MDNLILSFNVVLPLFLCIALGYFLKRIKMYDDSTLNKINKLCFKVFLPIYLFNSVYNTDLSAVFDIRLILFAIIALLILYALLLFIIPRMEKDDKKRGVIIQAIFRSNFALFGLPVASSLCGEENIGPTSLLIGIIVPIYNVLAVITLEAFRGGKSSIKKMIKGVITNPLIIAPLIGVIFYLLHIELQTAVSKTVTDLGRVATPLSLVALGGSFAFRKVKGYAKQLMIGISGKLAIAPLLMITVAILLGFRNETLTPLMIMFGAPTAVSSFPMAQQMDADGELAGQFVVFTSGLAIFTIFVWIFTLKSFSFI